MNARFSQIRHAIASKNTAVLAALSAPMFAMAQAVDPFVQAAQDVTVKVESYGGTLVGLAAVSVIFLVGIKYVKKIRSAA